MVYCALTYRGLGVGLEVLSNAVVAVKGCSRSRRRIPATSCRGTGSRKSHATATATATAASDDKRYGSKGCAQPPLQEPRTRRGSLN